MIGLIDQDWLLFPRRGLLNYSILVNAAALGKHNAVILVKNEQDLRSCQELILYRNTPLFSKNIGLKTDIPIIFRGETFNNFLPEKIPEMVPNIDIYRDLLRQSLSKKFINATCVNRVYESFHHRIFNGENIRHPKKIKNKAAILYDSDLLLHKNWQEEFNYLQKRFNKIFFGVDLQFNDTKELGQLFLYDKLRKPLGKIIFNQTPQNLLTAKSLSSNLIALQRWNIEISLALNEETLYEDISLGIANAYILLHFDILTQFYPRLANGIQNEKLLTIILTFNKWMRQSFFSNESFYNSLSSENFIYANEIAKLQKLSPNQKNFNDMMFKTKNEIRRTPLNE